ncbi:MAG: glycosyltransferase family 4 protein [Bacteroidota bacterium]
MMKVAMIVRATFYSSKGGDTVQVQQTAAHLAEYNIPVDIKLTNENIDYKQYDLLHFFNITRPADILYHIRKAGKPFFVSTILIDYSEYDKYHRQGFAGMLFRFLNADAIEYLKTITRWVAGKDRLMSLEYIWKGQRRTIIEILKQAALLLPNSHSEYKRLIQQYNCVTDHVVIPNGVDTGLFSFNNAIEKDPRLVLCVARIEGLKNQVNLIRALKNTNFNLVIIGAAALNQTSYYHTCREIATGNIHFIEHLPQEELVSYYQKAKVHVLASWFETTGLSSLEAAAMGCNIVVTDKGDTREYFGNDASYCDPGSPENIYNTIEKAATLPTNGFLQQKILAQYSWEEATIRTMEAYKLVKDI